MDGCIQLEGEVVHLVAYNLFDLSGQLTSVRNRGAAFRTPRGDEFARESTLPDPRDGQPRRPRARDIYIPDLHIDTIKQKTRDFR